MLDKTYRRRFKTKQRVVRKTTPFAGIDDSADGGRMKTKPSVGWGAYDVVRSQEQVLYACPEWE